ncbi:MAG: ATPase, T2SS/T4P/T4SS family, partial [bacterium]|nr:ATPase, T2SS/T4P/T4SS family [bacterium]
MIQIPNDKLKELLIGDSLITAAAFDDLVKEATRMGQVLSDILISRGVISQQYFFDLLTLYYHVPKADFSTIEIDKNLLKSLSVDIARSRHVIVFREEPDGAIAVAMEDPSDLGTIEFLKQKLKRDIRVYFATPEDLNKGFLMYGAEQAGDFNKLIQENVAASMRSRAQGIAARAVEVPIVAIIDNILTFAISQRASDIHLEMLEDSILLRYRVDGVLREIFRMPKEIGPALIARLKLLGGLKIDEHTQSQDGRFRHKIGEETVDVRISVISTFNGEKVEMRLLASSQKPLSLEELGMLDDMSKIIKENIKKTFGMLLVTGPTGSGKTTTLYSILNMLNRPEVNIVTIEDPIEYDIRYINQTQINTQAGITFANGLRSILR